MTLWTFLTIIIVTAIIAGTISEYLKKQQTSRSEFNSELENLKKDMTALRMRVENLETIAAGDPDEFAEYQAREKKKQENSSKEPKDEINDIILKRRNKSW